MLDAYPCGYPNTMYAIKIFSRWRALSPRFIYEQCIHTLSTDDAFCRLCIRSPRPFVDGHCFSAAGHIAFGEEVELWGLVAAKLVIRYGLPLLMSFVAEEAPLSILGRVASW